MQSLPHPKSALEFAIFLFVQNLEILLQASLPPDPCTSNFHFIPSKGLLAYSAKARLGCQVVAACPLILECRRAAPELDESAFGAILLKQISFEFDTSAVHSPRVGRKGSVNSF